MKSFVGGHQILEFDSVSSSDDNPFSGSRVQPTGKVSVKLPVDDWLCRKMEKQNLTILLKATLPEMQKAAGLSRCLTRVQDTMFTQVKNLHLDKGKGKSSERT